VSDPYKSGLAGAVKFHEKRIVRARVVVILKGTIKKRGLQLITPQSRCVREKEIFEFMIAEDKDVGPGKTADTVRYLGFAEVERGGSIRIGDKVLLNGETLGQVVGFDETHMPNHQNVVLRGLENTPSVESRMKLESNMEFLGGDVPQARAAAFEIKKEMPPVKDVQTGKIEVLGSTHTPGNFEEKIEALGYTLPEVAAPVAAYVPAVKVDDIIYTAGQVAFVKGELQFKGRLGDDVTVDDGYQAAAICALNALAAVKSVAGSLDDVARIVRVAGYVNSTNDFTDQAKVLNGASELMLKIFGDAGRHARSAIGVNTLPLGACVEVELVVKLGSRRDRRDWK